MQESAIQFEKYNKIKKLEEYKIKNINKKKIKNIFNYINMQTHIFQ